MPVQNIYNVFNDPILNKLFFNNIIPIGTSDVILGIPLAFPNLKYYNLQGLEVFSIFIHFSYTSMRIECIFINRNFRPQDLPEIETLYQMLDLFNGDFNKTMITLFLKHLFIGLNLDEDELILINYS